MAGVSRPGQAHHLRIGVGTSRPADEAAAGTRGRAARVASPRRLRDVPVAPHPDDWQVVSCVKRARATDRRPRTVAARSWHARGTLGGTVGAHLRCSAGCMVGEPRPGHARRLRIGAWTRGPASRLLRVRALAAACYPISTRPRVGLASPSVRTSQDILARFWPGALRS